MIASVADAAGEMGVLHERQPGAAPVTSAFDAAAVQSKQHMVIQDKEPALIAIFITSTAAPRLRKQIDVPLLLPTMVARCLPCK